MAKKAMTSHDFPGITYVASHDDAPHTIRIAEIATGRRFARTFYPEDLSQRLFGPGVAYAANAIIAMRPTSIELTPTHAIATWAFIGPVAAAATPVASIRTDITMTIAQTFEDDAAAAAATESKRLRADIADLTAQIAELRFATIGNRILDYFDANIFSAYLIRADGGADGAIPAFMADTKHWIRREISAGYDISETSAAVGWRFDEHGIKIRPPGEASAFTYMMTRIAMTAQCNRRHIANFLGHLLPYVDTYSIATMREWILRMDAANCVFVAKCLRDHIAAADAAPQKK